ncbi:T-cell surface glycoprotein CD3 zeta chain [Acipenser ruthenus]|uniref:T-cell surface glycoprotein CD3 zeta chain n=1 Tax=Acipenser ruthenus TaxID=7906 RepID=A0A444UP21_ACIRT|nr:T-cell surface glycoprotein CD3 zeta chain [Acipenser ruthenus]
MLLLSTEAEVLGLTDPKLCYILDGVLLLYSVIITALYFKNKFSKAKDKPQKESLYADLDRSRVEVYDQANSRPRDPETGGVGKSLKKDRPVDAYSEIGLQKQNQEGLSAATKDTYDSLQMQPLPPR